MTIPLTLMTGHPPGPYTLLLYLEIMLGELDCALCLLNLYPVPVVCPDDH